MKSTFKKELISGTLYTGIAKYLSIGVSIGVTAVLSRLLVPADFGIIAIASIFIGIITLLTGSGMSPAIIQDRTLNKKELKHIFSFTIYLAFVGTIIFLACAPIIKYLYNDEQLLHIYMILSINVFFSILNIVPNALLFKEKRFKYIALRTFLIQATLGIISIGCAFGGFGIYALLINPVIGSILLFIISYSCYPIKFSLSLDFTPIKRILPYSIYQIGFNLINYTYRNIDKLLIGKYMGFSQLGFYEKSYRLMMLPLENIANIINPVLHPLLCEYQNDHQFIFEKYKKIIQYFAYLGFPLSVLCFFSAEEMILLLFGTQWQLSIEVFKILSLSIGIQLIQSAVGAVFQSTGHVKQMFYSGLVTFIVTIGAISAGIYSHNLDQLATYIVIAFYIAFVIYHWVLIVQIMKVSMISFLSILIRPILASIIISIPLLIINFYFKSESLFINLIIKFITGIIMFIVLQEFHLIKGIPSSIKFIQNVIFRQNHTN